MDFPRRYPWIFRKIRVGFTDMSRRFTSESLHSGASLWLTRQGISLFTLLDQRDRVSSPLEEQNYSCMSPCRWDHLFIRNTRGCPTYGL